MPIIPGTFDPNKEREVVGSPAPAEAAPPMEAPAMEAPEVEAPVVPSEDIFSEESMKESMTNMGGRLMEGLERSRIYAASKDPQKHAQVLDMAAKTGLPVGAVEQEFDTVQRSLAAKPDLPDIVKHAPIVANWLTNIDNFALAKDDLENLSRIEKDQKQASGMEQMLSIGKIAYSNLAQGIAGAPAFLYNTMVQMNKATMEQKAADMGASVEEIFPAGNIPYASKELVNNKTAKFWKDVAAEETKKVPVLTEDVIDALSKAKDKKGIEHAALVVGANIAVNLPQQSLIIMSTMSGVGIPALLAAGGMSGSTAMQKAYESGVSPEAATQNALVHFGAETGFERFGTYGILKHWEKAIAKSYGKGISREFFVNLGKTFAYSFAGEGTEEFSTSMAQDFADYITDVNPKALEGMWKRAGGAFVVGGASGFATTAPAATYSGIMNSQEINSRQDSAEILAPKISPEDQQVMADLRHKEREATLAKDNYIRMGDSITASKTTEIAPGKMQEVTQEIYDQAGKGKVRIKAAAIDALFQSDDGKKNEFIQKMDILEQYEDSKKTGTPIEVPTARWMLQLAPEKEHRKFADHVTFASDALPLAEVKTQQEITKESNDKKLEIQKEHIASAREAAKLFVGQLKDVNQYGSSDLGGIEDLIATHLYARSKVRKISPMEVYQNEGLPPSIIQFADVPSEMRGALEQAMFEHPATKVSPLGYYSALARAVDTTPDKAFLGSPKELLTKLSKTQGVKQEEIKVTGLDEFMTALADQGQKVTKEQVLDFLQNNGLKIQQVVLSDDFGNNNDDSDDGAEPTVDNLSWSEPVRDDSDLSSDIDNELEYYFSTDNKDDIVDTIKKWLVENPDTLDEEESGTAEELYELGVTGRYRLDIWKLPSALTKHLDKHYTKIATENVESDEYHGARFTVKESRTGETLNGSDEMGWWNDKLRDSVYNLNEAKVQLTAKLLDLGEISGSVSDISKEEDFSWGSLRGHDVKYETKEKKAKALFKQNPENYLSKASEYYGDDVRSDWWIKLSEKEKATRIKDQAIYFAEREIDEQYQDPNNKKNKLTIPIDHPIVSGKITGNNVLGWKISASSEDVDKKEFDLAAKDIEMAQEEAKAWLISEGFMKKTEVASEASAEIPVEEVNKPTGKARWGQYVVGEDRNSRGEKYRVFLLRLPGNKGGGFSETVHFPNVKDVVVFMRVTDRVGANGEKVLLIEELQSDWQEHAFKFGVKDEGFDSEANENQREELAEKFIAIMESLEPPRKLRIGSALDNSDDFASLPEEAKKLAIEYNNLWNAQQQNNRAISPAPFQENKAYSALGVKRMITLAIQEGYDAVAVTPAEVHIERWGTDSMAWMKKVQTGFGIQHNGASVLNDKWIKDTVAKEFATKEEAEKHISLRVRAGTSNPDWQKNELANFSVSEPGTYFLVGATEQRGGNVDEGNIEELARQRGLLLETEGEKVSSKEDLADIVKKFLSRDRAPKQQAQFVEKIWNKMLKEDTGIKEPRKEGMQKAYDDIIPNSAMANTARVLDPQSKVEDMDIKVGDDTMSMKAVRITEKMKLSILGGLPYFQASQEPGGKIVRGFFSKLHNLIGFTKHKNLSTFFHEYGHYLFSSVQDDYNFVKTLETRDAIQEQFMKDVDALLVHLGAESVDTLTIPQQEEFARLFEAYLYKGKAPTTKLQSAFDSFRFLLKKIYQSLTDLNVKFTPELSGIFDRLIAADDAIDRVAMQQAAELDPKALNMSGKQLAEYQQAMYNIEQEAKAMLASELLLNLRTQQEKEYKEQEANVREEVRANLEEVPIYKAIAILKKGELPNGVQVIDGQLKISRQEVVEKYGREFMLALPKSILSNDGMLIDSVADMLGFESGSDLMNGIRETPPMDKVLRETVDRVMQERFPDLMQEPLLSEAAKEALYNDSKEKFLKVQSEMLYKEYKKLNKDLTRRMAAKPRTSLEVREEAKIILGKVTVGDVKPYKYELAEKAAAREAGVAAARGDIEAAYEAKNRERLNHELYKESQQFIKFQDKEVKKVKKIYASEEDLAGRYEINSLNAAKAVLSLYGITKADKTAAEYMEEMKKYDVEAYNANMPYIEEASVDAKNYKEVSVAKFTEMMNSVNALITYARSQKQIFVAGQKITKEHAIEQLIEQILKVTQPKALAEFRSTVGEKEAKRADFMDMAAKFIRVSHFTDAADAGGGKAFTTILRDPVQEKTNLAIRDTFLYTEKLRDIIIENADIFNNIEVIAKELTDSKGVPFKFKDMAELLMAILHTGNDSNKQKLLRGREWGTIDPTTNELDTTKWDAFISRMYSEKIITKKHMDFAQQVWDLMESMKPMAQEAHKQRFGRYFSEITANKIITPFAEYRGGYIPAKVAIYENLDAKTREARELFELNNSSWSFPTAGSGFTKARIEAYSAPLSLDMSLLGTHINSVMKFSHIENTVKDIAVLLSDKQLVASLEELHPGIVKHALLPWLDRSAKQQVVTPGDSKYFDNVLRHITKGVSTNILTFNVTNYLQQYTGIIVAHSLVKHKHIRDAFANKITNGEKMLAEMLEKSVAMQNLQGHSVFEMNDAIEKILTAPSGYEKTVQFIKDSAAAANSFTQNQTNTVVWWAAYNQSMTENPANEKAAILFADDIVKRTQGSPFAQDISAFEVGTPFAKLFKMFYTYFNGIANLNVFAYKKGFAEGGSALANKRLAFVFFWSVYVTSVMGDVIRRGLSGKDLDEDDDNKYIDDVLDVMLGAPIRYTLATLPVAGQALSATWNRFNDKVYDDKASFSPVFGIVDTTNNVVQALYKEAFTKKKVNYPQLTKDAAMAVGVLAGVPLLPVAKPVAYTMGVKDKKIKQKGKPGSAERIIDTTRGLITGKGERRK